MAEVRHASSPEKGEALGSFTTEDPKLQLLGCFNGEDVSDIYPGKYCMSIVIKLIVDRNFGD